jgi:hypothetical protein
MWDDPEDKAYVDEIIPSFHTNTKNIRRTRNPIADQRSANSGRPSVQRIGFR